MPETIANSALGIVVITMVYRLLMTTLKLRHEQARHSDNTRFLAAEGQENAIAEDRKQFAKEVGVQLASEAVSISVTSESAFGLAVERLSDGHTPECSYCQCGQSKAVEGLRDFTTAGRERRQAIETELRNAGWLDPAAQQGLRRTD